MEPCIGSHHLRSLTNSQLSALQEMETPDSPTTSSSSAVKHLDKQLLIEWGTKVTSWPKLYNFLRTSRFQWVQQKAEDSLIGTAKTFLKEAGLTLRVVKYPTGRSDRVKDLAVRRFNELIDLTITVDPDAPQRIKRELHRRAFISTLQDPKSWLSHLATCKDAPISSSLQSLTLLSQKELQSKQLDECDSLIAHWVVLNELHQKSGWTAEQFATRLAKGLSEPPSESPGSRSAIDNLIEQLTDEISGARDIRDNLGDSLGKAVLKGLEAAKQEKDLVPVYKQHPQFSVIKEFKKLRDRAVAAGKTSEVEAMVKDLVSVQHSSSPSEGGLISTGTAREVSMQELTRFNDDLGRQVSKWEWQASKEQVIANATQGPLFYELAAAYFTDGPAPVDQQVFAAMTPDNQLKELQPILQKKFPLLKPDRIERLALRPDLSGATLSQRLAAMQAESARLQEWVKELGDPNDVAQAIVRTVGPEVLQTLPAADKTKLTTLKAIVTYSKQKLEPTFSQNRLPYQRSIFIAGITSLLDKEGLAGFELEGLVAKSVNEKTKRKIREHCFHAHGHARAQKWCATNSLSYPEAAPFIRTLLESFRQVEGWPKQHTLAYVDALLEQSLPLARSHQLVSVRIASTALLLNLQAVDSQKKTKRRTLTQSEITPLFQKVEGPQPGYTSVMENIRQQPGTATKAFLTDFFAELLPNLDATAKEALQEALTKVATAVDQAGLTSDKVLSKLEASQREDLLLFLKAAIKGKSIDMQNAQSVYELVSHALTVNIQRLEKRSGSESLQLEKLSPPGNVILPGLLDWVKTAKAYQKELKSAQATGNKLSIRALQTKNYVLEDNLDDLRSLRKLLGNRLLIKTGGMLTRFGITKFLIEKFISRIVRKLPMPEEQLRILLEAIPAITSALTGLRIDEPGTKKTLDHLQGMVNDLLGAIESNEDLNETDLSIKMLTHMKELAGDILTGSAAVFAGLEAVARMPATKPSEG